jgi:ATP-dependent DNA helicase RecG
MIDSKLTERQCNILNAVMKSPTITGQQMSEMLSVSQRAIERDLSYLQNNGILKYEGKVNDGAWVIMKNCTN